MNDQRMRIAIDVSLAEDQIHGAAGGRPRREALSGPGSLTPGERRIADLAAGGHTTRDITPTLFVTPRTVEGHLTNINRKLGISTRTALPDALAGDALA